MKLVKLLFCAAVFSTMAIGCSSDSDDNNDDNNNNNNGNNDPLPAFAMTWKMNGVQYNRNNTWGNNESTPSFWSAYPDTDYIRLQGTSSWASSDGVEINLILKRTDLVAGETYTVNAGTDEVTTHIDLINNSNQESENTREGAITVTSINTTTKRVKGTFHFKTSDSNDESPYEVNYDITDGTFDYRYDVEE